MNIQSIMAGLINTVFRSKKSITITFSIVAFFIIQCFTVWNGGSLSVFNSPDANANYTYAKRIYQSRQFAVPIPLEPSFATQYISTRSTKVIGSSIVPVGFAGLSIIAGLISKVLAVDVISYITIIFSSLALYCFYHIVSRFYNSESIGLLSLVLLAIHPAWWYYTNESLLPNILFVSFIIISLFLMQRLLYTQKLVYAIASAAAVGLALFVRFSEALWVAPLFVWMLYINRSCLRRKHIVLMVGICVMECVGIFLVHMMINASSAVFGYVIPTTSLSFANRIIHSILPFGFHPRLMIATGWSYIAILFWPYALMSLIGLVYWLRSRIHMRDMIRLIASSLFVFICIISIYGSWFVTDTPAYSIPSIAVSYVRYFLPIYVLLIPWCAYGLLHIMTAISKKFSMTIIAVCILLVGWHSYSIAIAHPTEGILAKHTILQQYEVIATWVDNSIPNDAIIITDKADKYLWPRHMIMPVPKDASARSAAMYLHAHDGIKMWYVGVVPPEFVESLRYNKVFTYADVGVYELLF